MFLGVGGLLRCAAHTHTLCRSRACREYFQLSEKLDPRAFKVFIANSYTERRRWYRLHRRVIELSLYIKCQVLFVDDETGRTLGTLSLAELRNFTAQASHLAALCVPLLHNVMLCSCPIPLISELISGTPAQQTDGVGTSE